MLSVAGLRLGCERIGGCVTGEEFEAGIKRLGITKMRLAEIMGCDRGVITERCKAPVVDGRWQYILHGLLAESAAGALVTSVGLGNDAERGAATGAQFAAGIKRLGISKTRLAEILGCGRGVIAERCKATVIDIQWRYVMLGLLAVDAASGLIGFVGLESKKADK